MDLRKVKKLIELVQESGIAELEVSSGDESVRIALHPSAAQSVVTSAPVAAPAASAVPASSSPDTASAAISVDAPMAGTFYRAPAPEAAPFVEVGQQVAAGEVVCIIESMKMMHEIRAAEGGTVTEVCVANATPIGTGARLFVLA